MAWTDWTYKAGSPEGTLESLSDYCLSVRIVAENIVGKRGKNPTVDYRHGEWSSPRKYIRAANVTLETVLRYTNSAGVVTHADGAAGHYGSQHRRGQELPDQSSLHAGPWVRTSASAATGSVGPAP